MPDPKTLKKAAVENYLLCPACSEAEGEEVYYHKRALKSERFLFRDPQRTCPEGHAIPESGA